MQHCAPPCPNFALTYSIEFTQPLLLHLLLAQPPSPLSVDVICVHRPLHSGLSLGKQNWGDGGENNHNPWFVRQTNRAFRVFRSPPTHWRYKNAFPASTNRHPSRCDRQTDWLTDATAEILTQVTHLPLAKILKNLYRYVKKVKE